MNGAPVIGQDCHVGEVKINRWGLDGDVFIKRLQLLTHLSP